MRTTRLKPCLLEQLELELFPVLRSVSTDGQQGVQEEQISPRSQEALRDSKAEVGDDSGHRQEGEVHAT